MSSTRSFSRRFSRTRTHHIQRDTLPSRPRTLLCLLWSLLAFLGLTALGTVAHGQPLPPASVPPRPPSALDAQAGDAPDLINGLRLQLISEEPTGIFFDRNTLRTRTAIVLSLRLYNDRPEEQLVSVSWRITDSSGRVLLRKTDRMQTAPGGLIYRRELFDARRMDAYLVTVNAYAKRDGRDDSAHASLPLAIVGTPPSMLPASALRPHSFFSLTAPALVSETDLDFYARIGARVLRSPWMPAANMDQLAPPGTVAPASVYSASLDPTALEPLHAASSSGTPVSEFASEISSNSFDLAALDRQMQARLRRNLATQGILFVPPDGSERTATGSEWARLLSSYLARYRAITKWEFAGTASSAQWEALAREIRVRHPNTNLLGPTIMSSSTNVSTASPLWDAAVIPVLQKQEFRPDAADRGAALLPAQLDDGAINSAALLRSLLAAQRRANSVAPAPLYVLQNADTDERDAVPSAGALVTHYMLAVLSGASGLSTSALSPVPAVIPVGETGAFREFRERQEHIRMARAAAFATMTRLLEDTSFSREVFPASPLLWGVSFQSPAARITVMWTQDDNARRARLETKLEGRVLDIFGNEIERTRRGKLVVPLSAVPVYIISNASADDIARAWREANIEGLPPLAAQALPITKIPGRSVSLVATAANNKPANGKKVPTLAPAVPPESLRVRLQNVSIRPIAGVLRMSPPPRWKLSRDTLNYRLQPGESRVYQFPVAQSMVSGKGYYPVTVSATVGRSRWQWKQSLRLATAESVQFGQSPQIDGDLSEWEDAAWMAVDARAQAEDRSSSKSRVFARVALRWDTSRLYIAAHVNESRFQPRIPDAATYAFWQGQDALQLAFGLRDDPWVKPARGPFRDTDYGYLLSPFDVTVEGGDLQIEARVLRLWSTSLSLDDTRDRVRWGGEVPGARCVIRRNEKRNVTFYEASLPLSEMPTLRPPRRAAGDVPVRFSWILHNDEGPALAWSRATSVFPWWSNPGSFLPIQYLHLAAQTPLGFTSDDVANDRSTVQTVTAPASPPRGRTPASQRRTPASSAPTSQVPPASPRVLPPDGQPDESNPLPPAPPSGGTLPELPSLPAR